MREPHLTPEEMDAAKAAFLRVIDVVGRRLIGLDCALEAAFRAVGAPGEAALSKARGEA